MAVWRSSSNYLILVLLLFASSLLDLSIGHQSPAPSHSCSHGHHHHHHHHDHHHDDIIDESMTKKKLLPEELAEEEDLKLFGFGFGSDHHHHHDHDHHHTGSQSQSLLSGVANGNPSKTVVDSLALFGVCFLYFYVLFLIGFEFSGAGAMLGDAFLHQLPHAFGNGGHSHGHGDHDHSETSHSHSVEDLSVGLSILLGIVVFLVVEKVVRYVEKFSGGEHSGTHTHHHHHKNSKKLKADEDSDKQSVQSQSKEKFIDRSIDDKVSEPKSDLKKRNKSNDGKRDKDTSNSKRGEAKSATQPSNRVFGYLNLFSDGVKNIHHWSSMLLSYAAKTQIINSAIFVFVWLTSSVLVFFFPMKQSIGLIECAKIFFRVFLMVKKKMVFKSWYHVGSPLDCGGFDIKNFASWNHAMLMSWIWKAQSFLLSCTLGQKFLLNKAYIFLRNAAPIGTLIHGITSSKIIPGILGWLGHNRTMHDLLDELNTVAFARQIIKFQVGDFGILVRSGFSVSKALFFNFLSALVALAGTALALLLGQDPGQSSLIEGFTAGGFIYISVAGVLAEMNNNGSPSLKSSVSQLISLVLGMAVALGISLLE
ncbi:hypothetical protein KSS87_001692 [Heliosperma pusillum]|nr:hypothetical protein KSS87_001692 [Heliosperma pusillum]